jgi:hypothetical protein
VKIRVENGYSDGHESTLDYDIPDADVPAFAMATEDEKKWPICMADGHAMWEFLGTYTGDGHGEDPDLGWFYRITILEAANPKLVGLSLENSGN